MFSVQWLSIESTHRYPDSLPSHAHIACYSNNSNTSCSWIHSDFHMNWKWVSWFRFHVNFWSCKLQTVKKHEHTHSSTKMRMHLVTFHRKISTVRVCLNGCFVPSVEINLFTNNIMKGRRKTSMRVSRGKCENEFERFYVDICHVPINDSLPEHRIKINCCCGCRCGFTVVTKSLILFPIDRQTHIVNSILSATSLCHALRLPVHTSSQFHVY